MVEATEDLVTEIESGGNGLIQTRAEFRFACSHAADSAVQIVDRLARMVGAVAILESLPLERCGRDVQAAAKHIAMSPNNYIVAGRLTLGLARLSARFSASVKGRPPGKSSTPQCPLRGYLSRAMLCPVWVGCRLARLQRERPLSAKAVANCSDLRSLSPAPDQFTIRTHRAQTRMSAE